MFIVKNSDKVYSIIKSEKQIKGREIIYKSKEKNLTHYKVWIFEHLEEDCKIYIYGEKCLVEQAKLLIKIDPHQELRESGLRFKPSEGWDESYLLECEVPLHNSQQKDRLFYTYKDVFSIYVVDGKEYFNIGCNWFQRFRR